LFSIEKALNRDSRKCDDCIYDVAVEMTSGMNICMRNGYMEILHIPPLHSCIFLFGTIIYQRL